MTTDWIVIVCIIFLSAFGAFFMLRTSFLEGKSRAQRQQIQAVKQSLMLVRARCTEAINLGEVLKTAESKHFARDIGWSMISLENQLGSLIPSVDEMAIWAARQMPISSGLREGGQLSGESDEFEPGNTLIDPVCPCPGTCQDLPGTYWERIEDVNRPDILHHRRRKDGGPSNCKRSSVDAIFEPVDPEKDPVCECPDFCSSRTDIYWHKPKSGAASLRHRRPKDGSPINCGRKAKK